jgi:hypothetical protein
MRASQHPPQSFLTCLLLFVLLNVSCSLFRGSLEIDARIIYNMGGPQPVARQTFYLLDVDPFTLRADDPKFKAKVDALTDKDQQMNLQLSGVMLMNLKLLSEKQNELKDESSLKKLLGTLEFSKPFWEDHIIQTVQTDFNGHALIENLTPGDYWLLAQTETRAAFTFWDLKVKVERGANKILLDQNNALFSK